MPDLFIFLLKVNAALLLFCAGYYLVLRHLTFYTLNRIYLISAILFATVYPQINLSAFAERHQQIAKPVETVILIWRAPARALIEKPDYWLWVEIVFWAGVVMLAARLFIQLYSLFKLYRSSTAAQIHGHDVRVINHDSGPFSFWKSIYINPAKHAASDLRSILQHEQVHVSQWHTLDVLLAELSTIFYWFNPGVWLMKKAIKENIEFITDRKILKSGTDTKQYQYSLVNVSLSATPQGIVNHFNMSTIKKRIIMMNAKRSSKVKLTRYVFLIPAVVALLLVFSISKAELVTKSIKNIANITIPSVEILAPKATVPAIAVGHNMGLSAATVIKKNITHYKFTQKLIDTIRKGTFFISSAHNLDSSNIVINGVKSAKRDFDKLNPNDIESVNIMSAGIGNDLVDKLDKNHGTIFVTTKGSEAGNKFREKLDKLNNAVHLESVSVNGRPSNSLNNVVVVGRPANIVITSTNNSGSGSSTTTTTTTTGSGNTTTKVQTYNISKNSTPLQEVTVQGYPINNSDRRTDNGRTDKDSSNKRNVLVGDVVVIGRKTDNKPLKEVTVVGHQAAYSNFSSTYSPPSAGLVDHIADKMVIINGKISTQADLKKISAFDIDKIVVKNDNETKELYGDKAKNGIVFIVTKKGEK